MATPAVRLMPGAHDPVELLRPASDDAAVVPAREPDRGPPQDRQKGGQSQVQAGRLDAGVIAISKAATPASRAQATSTPAATARYRLIQTAAGCGASSVCAP